MRGGFAIFFFFLKFDKNYVVWWTTCLCHHYIKIYYTPTTQNIRTHEFTLEDRTHFSNHLLGFFHTYSFWFSSHFSPIWQKFLTSFFACCLIHNTPSLPPNTTALWLKPQLAEEVCRPLNHLLWLLVFPWLTEPSQTQLHWWNLKLACALWACYLTYKTPFLGGGTDKDVLRNISLRVLKTPPTTSFTEKILSSSMCLPIYSGW